MKLMPSFASLNAFRKIPAGTVRINAGEQAALAVVWPALAKALGKFSDVQVEVVVDYGLTDTVTQRYDAGVRIGEQVAKDMIGAIERAMRMAAVAVPSYFKTRPPPRTPRDLTEHSCIKVRLPTSGGLYVLELEKRGREMRGRRPVGPLALASL